MQEIIRFITCKWVTEGSSGANTRATKVVAGPPTSRFVIPVLVSNQICIAHLQGGDYQYCCANAMRVQLLGADQKRIISQTEGGLMRAPNPAV